VLNKAGQFLIRMAEVNHQSRREENMLKVRFFMNEPRGNP
jgi:hypothetical protein